MWGVPVRRDGKRRPMAPRSNRPAADDFDTLMQLASTHDGLNLDLKDLNLDELFDEATLSELQKGFQSVSSLLDSADLTSLASPEAIKEMFQTNPVLQSLANVDEIKELFQSADFNDPKKMEEALKQAKDLFQELYKEVLAIISDKQKLKQFINELLAEMDPSSRLLIEQILSFDMEGIASILDKTLADFRDAVTDPVQVEELRKMIVNDRSIMATLPQDLQDLLRDQRRFGKLVQDHVQSIMDIANANVNPTANAKPQPRARGRQEQDKDAWRRE